MKIIGIESTAVTASAALAEDDKCLFVFTQTTALKHSETLLPMLENGLNVTSHTMDDVDMIAVTAGPGSFTGVRIGVSMAKGLAFGRSIPCVGVSTLESLAFNLSGFCGLLCPVMDARRGQLYNALFLSDGETITRLTPDRLISAEELKKELSEREAQAVYFCGDGYRIARETIDLPSVKETPQALRHQNAFSTTQIARKLYEQAENKNAFTDEALAPVYLRASQAERESLEKEQREQTR
ncbi:MAG: tRNA (adenosine(37)-N6)-threonylcarbamoyltransferase complex dimerization subunit type 1 TsaB [Ruminococcaceae bacterium]|nr:tRNA (adenosine(37)-N6)-threonylcarbamoyltransferase complex dimerization subunit type 1 TsaB [Oscillospiraceae bacterium]